MQPSGLSLSEIRKRLAGEQDESRLRQWADALDLDRRAGARQLADACRRRMQRAHNERLRLEALFSLRARLLASGTRAVAGVDEVGVGPLAGPVVAAAVILPESVSLPGLNDSKKLSPKVRDRLCEAIRKQAIAVGIGEVSPPEIDRLNIFRASLEAMRRAVESLPVTPDHLLVDARAVPRVSMSQTAIIGGDALDGSIAAASIVAKVYRDRLMAALDRIHPGYGFAQHKGYPTADHVQALRQLGASPVHRRSFGPVADAIR
jgi:ribonuclease HII